MILVREIWNFPQSENRSKRNQRNQPVQMAVKSVPAVNPVLAVSSTRSSKRIQPAKIAVNAVPTVNPVLAMNPVLVEPVAGRIATRKACNKRGRQQLVRIHCFNKGEIVWAKMKGFPLWPAKVILKNFFIFFENFHNSNFLF